MYSSVLRTKYWKACGCSAAQCSAVQCSAECRIGSSMALGSLSCPLSLHRRTRTQPAVDEPLGIFSTSYPLLASQAVGYPTSLPTREEETEGDRQTGLSLRDGQKYCKAMKERVEPHTHMRGDLQLNKSVERGLGRPVVHRVCWLVSFPPLAISYYYSIAAGGEVVVIPCRWGVSG